MQPICGLQNGVIISFHIFLLAVILSKQINLPLHCMETVRYQLISWFKIKYLLKKQLGIPVTYSYEKFIQKYFVIQHINSKLNAADSSTKATSGPLRTCETLEFPPGIKILFFIIHTAWTIYYLIQ